jgi:hypothetical protein
MPRRWGAPLLLVAGVATAHVAVLGALAERSARASPTTGPGASAWTLAAIEPLPRGVPPAQPHDSGQRPALPFPAPIQAGSPADGRLPSASGDALAHPQGTEAPAAGSTGTQSSAGTAPDNPSPAAFQPPPAFQVDYRVQGQRRGVPVAGEALLTWERGPGDHYVARLHTRLAGAAPRTQESAGRIARDGFSPARFADHGRSEQATHFDGERLVFSRSGPQSGLRRGAQDPVSALLQLAGLAAAEPARFATDGEVAFQVAGTHEVQEWRFTSEGLQTLQLPWGSVEAIRLVRMPSQPFDWHVEAWLAPIRDYAPVRLRLTRADGDWLDHLWPGTDKR